MAEVVATLLTVAAVLVVADLLLEGGAMTVTGMSAVAGVVGHPLAAAALTVLVVALILVLGAAG